MRKAPSGAFLFGVRRTAQQVGYLGGKLCCNFILREFGPAFNTSFTDKKHLVPVPAHYTLGPNTAVMRDVVGHDDVGSLLRAVRAGTLADILGLCRKANDKARPLVVMPDLSKNIGILDHLQRRRGSTLLLLDLLRARVGCTPISDCGNEYPRIGRKQAD